MTLHRIISGGQTGADQGGLFAARDLGIETGGHAPSGWRTETGPAPWLEKYGLRQSLTHNYNRRTHTNISNADATLIFGDANSIGSALTLRLCEKGNKKFCIISWRSGSPVPEIDEFVSWVDGVSILNVAGNRESRQPGISDMVCEFLISAITRYRETA